MKTPAMRLSVKLYTDEFQCVYVIKKRQHSAMKPSVIICNVHEDQGATHYTVLHAYILCFYISMQYVCALVAFCILNMLHTF